MSNRPEQSVKAFTLLELLVAMTIMAIITASLYSTLSLAFKIKDTTLNTIGPQARMNAIFDIIRNDLSCCVSPDMTLAGAFLGNNEEILDNDQLIFSTSNYISFSEEPACDIYRVEYSLERYDQWSGYALVKRTATNVLSQSDPTTKEEILCRNIYYFDVLYFDGSDWTNKWDSESTETPLPTLVKISIITSRKNEIDFTDPETVLVSRIISIPEQPVAEEEEEGQGQ